MKSWEIRYTVVEGCLVSAPTLEDAIAAFRDGEVACDDIFRRDVGEIVEIERVE